ncbi:hydrolase [Aquiflexum lacus]|uniref:hydrolase n=1 Tax=Aquiflexum lacus TaxID=2483805 RepID=UPI0018935226|nr:hydrolase [Aquiflexum lacus]
MKARITLTIIVVFISMNIIYAQKPGDKLLSPNNHTLILIDHQPQMAFATQSHSVELIRNNAAMISKAAKAFKSSVVITSVAAKSFSGPIFSEITDVFPSEPVIDRTTMNTWEDPAAYKAIIGKGKKKLVFAGLWTEVCIVGPVLSALGEGYDVYFITDASGGVSKEAHDMAVARMIQAGAQPMTSIQYLLELQRDWARQETYDVVNEIAKEHGGGYGLGIKYAKEMFNAQEGKK